MASVYERITSALSSLGKRRERDSSAHEGGSGAGAGTPARAPKRFRPWEQSDLHRRLETFKPLTWFAKPTSVGPVPCALRGWVNDANDTLCCEYCNAKLIYPPQVAYDQRQAAADMFSPSLTTKHAATCPWRQTQCNPSLLAYVPSACNDQLCALFNTLQDKLLRVELLPDMDTIAIRTVRDAAMPYGPYDDLILGGGGGASGSSSAGAIVAAPRRRQTPSVLISELDGGGASTAAGAAAATAGGGGGGGEEEVTLLLQHSKLTPAQKVRLLALLGWDLDVLQPDSASGSAVAPYTQNSSYSLQHLGVKSNKGTAATAAAGKGGGASHGGSGSGAGGIAGAGGKVPMSSVVLKCHHCNGRMGLWNFAGVRPVPTGRLTPGVGGAAALLSPRVTAAAASCGAAGSSSNLGDPLSGTIAGGLYGQYGAAGARPFGAAGGGGAAAPFRFGSAAASAPVFGVGALEADAQRKASAATGGGGSGFGLFGLGSPGVATATPTVTPTATPVAGRKRKGEEQGGPEPMAVDGAAGDGRSSQQGQPGPSGSVAGGGTDVKRPRLQSSFGGAGAGPGTPGGQGHAAGAGADGQLRDLDPLSQHRSWCPWVYTGAGEERHMSGWQHMLSALASQQQHQQAAAVELQAAAVGGGGREPQPVEGGAALGVDPKQLRDSALASIRAL